MRDGVQWMKAATEEKKDVKNGRQEDRKGIERWENMKKEVRQGDRERWCAVDEGSNRRKREGCEEGISTGRQREKAQ